MKMIADLHIHSRFSMATSKEGTPENLDFWARKKGISLIGTGDFTHPVWREELKERLVSEGNGLYRLRDEYVKEESRKFPGEGTRFVVSGEISSIYKKNGKNIAVINLIGRVDIAVLSENPFLKAKSIIDSISKKVDIIIVDFHAEATAEKIAMGYYLDGKVTALFGTHTHVQTADEKILPNGTGYITDIGMTGPKNSVIGMNIQASIKRFETTLPERYKIAEGECMFNGVIFEIDDKTNKVIGIERIIKY